VYGRRVSESSHRGRPSAPVSSVGERWAGEAIRVYRRYQLEVVEACGLCPWAERARLEGSMRERVLLQTDGRAIDPSVLAIQDLAVEERIEVALLIFPRIELGRNDFDQFVARVREADTRCHPLGEVPFMFAAFHPDAAPDVTHAERLIPFLRRTPDPSLQLVRGTSLERVRARAPQGTQFVDIRSILADDVECALPLRERIARTNLTTTQRMGVDELRRRLDDILHDRDESYQALATEQTELVPSLL
jgi:hypothetical protein